MLCYQYVFASDLFVSASLSKFHGLLNITEYRKSLLIQLNVIC